MDLNSIKQFFINHIEKVVLGIVGLIACFLLYRGVSKPSYLAKQKPEELTQSANRVKLGIEEDHTQQIFKEEDRQPNTGVMARTAKLFQPIDAPAYKPRNTWAGGVEGASVVRRHDPLLTPIKSLRTMGVSCAIALNGGKTPSDYSIAALEEADPVEKEEKKKPIRRRKKKPAGNPEMGMGGMEAEMMGGPAMPGPERATGGTRKLDAKYNLGFQSQAESSTNNPVPRMSWFIAGTALLPHKEIYEAFELAFENADGYRTTRDVPIYFDLEVQRADITDVAVNKLAEKDWEDIYNRLDYVKLAARFWNGFAPEIVPADYRDDNLTMWIPPVLLDDYSKFSLHPDIPLISRSDLKQRDNKNQSDEEEETIDLENIDLGEGEELAGPTGGDRRMGGGADFGGERSMMGGGSEMRMFGVRGTVDVNPVDYKLIRFYDFGATLRRRIKPGRTYVYRLRYAVVDPNYPLAPRSQPKLSSLTPDVAQRVSQKMAETRKTDVRNFRFWSDWSEPSEPCKLPTLSNLYAGSVSTGNYNKVLLNGKQILVPRETPTANVVLTELDQDMNSRVSMVVERIKEGAVLAAPAKAVDVIDPITLEIKKLPEYQITTGTSVIDLGGGQPLSIRSGLTSPGTMLLYNANGDLIVSDDISDQYRYRIYSFADEKGQ